MLATVTATGQITIPKAIRDLLNILPGSQIDFEVATDRTLHGRVVTRGSDGLLGLLHRPGRKPRTLDEMDISISATVAEHSLLKTKIRALPGVKLL